MGVLRTLLAISVVFAHSYGFVFVGGQNAVQLFYMISGFLISYILVEKKSYDSVGDFYINRFLRLYPIYAVVALLSVCAIVFASFIGVADPFFGVYRDAPVMANVLLVLSNVTLMFQDWVMFVGVEGGRLVFSSDYSASDVLLYHGLAVPQAWTLGLELTFYMLAPFILGRRNVLLLLLFLSVLLRIFLILIGVGGTDPWTYRFFPAELALFVLGALSHQVLLPYYRRVLTAGRMQWLAGISTYFLVFVVLVYWLVPVHDLVKTVVLFAVFLVLLPFAFVFQGSRGWDRWVGDLSYPVYICHVLVIKVVYLLLSRFGVTDELVVGGFAIVFSIAFAVLLNAMVAKPVELVRNGFRVREMRSTSQVTC